MAGGRQLQLDGAVLGKIWEQNADPRCGTIEKENCCSNICLVNMTLVVGVHTLH